VILPDFLYEFRQPRDGASGAFQIIIQANNAESGNVTSFTVEHYVVPKDRALILTAFQSTGRATGGQIVTSGFLEILSRDGGIRFGLRVSHDDSVANGSMDLDWQGQVWIPPGFKLQSIFTFDAGASPNHHEVGAVMGVVIPVGNIQQG